MPDLHLIGNAHLDPVWLWKWQEGFSEVKATFRSALDRMNEFPGFIFTCAGACYYQWIEENEPAMFEEIRKRVKEGRWVLAGGWWIQPDCNIPSGESFIRQGLYSQRYFMQKFGLISSFGYNVDSFGHNAMLPQILKKCGLKYYVMRRPESHELDLDANVFWWQGIDGSQVLTYRIPCSYCSGESAEELLSKRKELENLSNEQGTPMMYFYGVGNHGGGPTITTLRILEDWMSDSPEGFTYSSPELYFDQLCQSESQFPIVKKELQRHAIGCYSAVSEMKANNRKAECMLAAAEKAMALAGCLFNTAYNRHDLERAWKCVLFNQFHDILGGCSIREAYEDARDFHGEALKTSQEILNNAIQKISWAIDTSKGRGGLPGKNITWSLWEHEKYGSPIVVFNLLSWDVKTAVQLNKHISFLEDENGNCMEIQPVRGSRTNEDDKWDTLFYPEIPAMGYRVFWAHTHAKEKPETENKLKTSEYELENEFLILKADPASGYIQIFDKETATQVFNQWGAIPLVIEDLSDTWAHGVLEFRKEVGRFGQAKVMLTESGPVRAALRIISHYGSSWLQQDFSIYKGSPAVEVKLKLNWQEGHKILKLSFPVNVQDSEAVYEIPYGFIYRKQDGLENPGQSWVDVTGRITGGKAYGLALANDAKYSYDVLNSDLRMTVARSAFYADHFGERDESCEYMDQGIQYMKYILLPHGGTWQDADIVKRTDELLNPPITVLETFHDGVLPQAASYMDISAGNIIATVLKQAEDGNDLILRCRETHGIPADARINLRITGCAWDASFKPHEIKTFRIKDGNEIEETDLLERLYPKENQIKAK